MESNLYNFTSLVRLVRENFLVFLVVGIVAAILGFIISLPSFMPPKYSSSAVVYPINLEPYSDESETEQLLQYFEASAIRDSLIAKFNLFDRYEIDPETESARYYLIQEYNDRVVVNKTRYESVRLEVQDEDPVIAKEMADEILNQVTNKIRVEVNQWGMANANSYKKQLDYQQSVIDSIEVMSRKLNVDNNLLDYTSQSRELMRGYIEYAGRGSKSPVLDTIQNWLKSSQETGSMVRMLQNMSYFAANQFDILSRDYLFWRERAFSDTEYLQVIVSPEVSDKKIWPVRWIILAVSVISSLVLTAVVLAISRSIKQA
jgi:capsular polysaccharide biosynthesis protein